MFGKKKSKKQRSRSNHNDDVVDNELNLDDVVLEEQEEEQEEDPRPTTKQKKRNEKQRTQKKRRTAKATSSKKSTKSPSRVANKSEIRHGHAFLDAADFNLDDSNAKPQYYKKRPKSGFKEWFYSKFYPTTLLFLIPLIVIALAISTGFNYKYYKQVRSQSESSYNPSFRERNADIGKSVIYAYYNGDPVPPISIAKGLKWPGGVDTEDAQNENIYNMSGDAASSGGTNSFGKDAKIAATVRNLSLVRSKVWDRKGTEEEVADNPALEISTMESLTYSGVFNGVISDITITLQTPGAKNPGEINPSDNLQPPILVGLPTITSGRQAVDGAPGTTDPGTLGGKFEPLSTVPEAVVQSLNSWAKAYAADDRQSLRDIVRDPQDGNYYGMLGGWSLKPKSVNTKWQYLRDDGLMVVGVEFIATQSIHTKDSKGEQEAVTTDNPQMMDVLVDFSNKGTPSVVAWGVSGSAQYLKPFSNSVSDNEVPEAKRADSSEAAETAQATSTGESESESAKSSEGLSPEDFEIGKGAKSSSEPEPEEGY